MKSGGSSHRHKMLLINFILFILFSAVIIISATFLVISLKKISGFLGISDFTAAFIIMAFATAAPELFIGVSSALAKVPSLSLGNLIGSSILHLTLIMGIFVLFARGIKIKGKKDGKGVYFVPLSILLLIILFAIGKSLSRIDGVILLAFFAFNIYRILKRRKGYKNNFKKTRIKKYHLIRNIIIFALSLIVLLISANYIVKYAILLAENLNVPNFIIGLFLVSFATALPELAFGFRAIKMGYREMAVGDLTGGVFTNMCLIVGIVALINPITATFTSFILPAILLLIFSFIFVIFMRSGYQLKNKEGIILILLYVGFMLVECFIKV